MKNNFYKASLASIIVPNLIAICFTIFLAASGGMGNYDILGPMILFSLIIIIGSVISVILFTISKKNNEESDGFKWFISLVMYPVAYFLVIVMINYVWY